MKKQKGLHPTLVYEEARLRLQELKEANEVIEARLQKAPEGKIHIINGENWVQYYVRMSSAERLGKYLSKRKDETTLRRYLQKSYDEKAFRLIQKEIKSLERFLKKSDDFNHQIQFIYADYPYDARAYIVPIDQPDEDYARFWQALPFIGNPIGVPNTEYKTDRGELVRSKSELNIANALNRTGISYRYEAPVFLRHGSTLYPDFTILATRKRKEIYWEHRGMMDDREYLRASVRKLKEYSRSGIIIGQNLLITEETSMNPLGTDEINSMIKLILSM